RLCAGYHVPEIFVAYLRHGRRLAGRARAARRSGKCRGAIDDRLRGRAPFGARGRWPAVDDDDSEVAGRDATSNKPVVRRRGGYQAAPQGADNLARGHVELIRFALDVPKRQHIGGGVDRNVRAGERVLRLRFRDPIADVTRADRACSTTDELRVPF